MKELLSNIGAGGAAPASGAPAAAAAGGAGDAPAEEEKKEEEKEESDDDMVRNSYFSGLRLLTIRYHRASVYSTSLLYCYPSAILVSSSSLNTHACHGSLSYATLRYSHCIMASPKRSRKHHTTRAGRTSRTRS